MDQVIKTEEVPPKCYDTSTLSVDQFPLRDMNGDYATIGRQEELPPQPPAEPAPEPPVQPVKRKRGRPRKIRPEDLPGESQTVGQP
ncbi:hypothetical protein HDU93_009649, partial [Gonapodya sp. JEL0774]